MKISKYNYFTPHPFRTLFQVLATEHFCFAALMAEQEGFQFLNFLPQQKKTTMRLVKRMKRKRKNVNRDYFFQFTSNRNMELPV